MSRFHFAEDFLDIEFRANTGEMSSRWFYGKKHKLCLVGKNSMCDFQRNSKHTHNIKISKFKNMDNKHANIREHKQCN